VSIISTLVAIVAAIILMFFTVLSNKEYVLILNPACNALIEKLDFPIQGNRCH